MTDFPTLSHTLFYEIPTISYNWSLKKVPLSNGASPYGPLYFIGRILGGFWNHCPLFRTVAQGWNSEPKITFFLCKTGYHQFCIRASIGMVAVIYCAIFLGDKGVNQSKVFAFCRIKRGFSQLFSSYLTGLAKITDCPGCRLAVTDEHISVDDWTEFLKSWLLILK